MMIHNQVAAQLRRSNGNIRSSIKPSQTIRSRC
jgi:hypothetical protein